MAADDDVANPKGTDCKLDDGANATKHFSICGNHISNVPRNKDLTRSRTGDRNGINARVGARDEQGMWGLLLAGSLREHLSLLREHIRLKALHSVYEPL
jgi:hypothetical protein